MSEPVKCCGRVFRNYHFCPCINPGKVEREGKLYCGIHDPVVVKARDDKTKARWEAQRIASDARYEAQRVIREHAELCVAACDLMSDEELKRMARLSRAVLRDVLY